MMQAPGNQQSRILVSASDELIKVARELYEKGYDHVISLSGIDWPKEKKIELIIHVSSYSNKSLPPKIVEIRLKIDKSNPHVPTLTEIWPSAEFHEREAFEMFGIIFDGHKDLRNILLDPEDFKDVHPMLKDFKVLEEDIMLKKVKEVK